MWSSPVKLLFLAGFFIVALTSAQTSDSVRVTFVANTAGVPDLIREHSTVQIRGGHPGLGYWTIDSPVFMSPIGGDYWETTVTFPKQDLNIPIQYRYATNRLPQDVIDGMWYGLEAGKNRQLDLSGYTGSDTTLPVEYVRGWENSTTELELFEDTDSIEIFLRVNMELEIKAGRFIDGFENVGVKGFREDGMTSGELSLSSANYLNREKNHANGLDASMDYEGKNFYSKVIRVPSSWAGKQINFKFVKFNILFQSEESEQLADNSSYRSALLPADGDTTIAWSRWGNQPLIEPGSVINVTEFGDDYFGDGTLGRPFYNISWAVFNANNGDTILLHPGMYYGNVKISEKDIYLTSKFLYTGSDSDVDQTVIDGDFNGPAISVSGFNTGTTVISGLTVVNGANSIGGGIYGSHAKLRLDNLRIRNNSAFSGGGIYISDCHDFQLVESEIRLNNADSTGGGIFIRASNGEIRNTAVHANQSLTGGGLAVFDHSTVTIVNSLIKSNSATDTRSAGGGVLSVNSSLHMDSVRVLENKALNGWAGGINFSNPRETGACSLYVNDTEIYGNRALNGGGLDIRNNMAADSRDTIQAVLTNTRISNNHATCYGGAYIGGRKIHVVMDSCEVDSNISTRNNGGIYLTNSAALDVTRSLVHRNISNTGTVETIAGSGLTAAGGAALKVIRSDIVNNAGSRVSGIMVMDASAFINTSLITNNEHYQLSLVQVNGSAGMDMNYSGIFPVDSAFLEDGFSSGLLDTTGMVLDDPLYVDLAENDYRLSLLSPMVDKGDPDLDNDGILWNNDVDDQDPDGSRLDVGLFPLFDSAVDITLASEPVSGSTIGPFESVSFLFSGDINISDPDLLINVINNNGDTIMVDMDITGHMAIIQPLQSFTTRDSIKIQFLPGITNPSGSLVKYNGLSGMAEYTYYVAGPGDFNQDGIIDLDDFSLFAGNWGSVSESEYELYPFEGDLEAEKIIINRDNEINYDDFLIFIYVWNLERNISEKQISADGELATENFIIQSNSNGNVIFTPTDQVTAFELTVQPEKEGIIRLGQHTPSISERWLELISRNEEKRIISISRAAMPGPGTSRGIEMTVTGDRLAVEINGIFVDGSRFYEKGFITPGDPNAVPEHFALERNYPNPFNPSTVIPFSVPEKVKVLLAVYDITGRPVKTLVNSQVERGYHRAVWNGRDSKGKKVPAGVYLCRFEAGQFRQSLKVMLIK